MSPAWTSLEARLSPLPEPAVDGAQVGRVAGTESEASEGRRAIDGLGGVRCAERLEGTGDVGVDLGAVETARAGCNGGGAYGHAVLIGDAVLVTQAELAEAAAKEDPGLVGVVAGVGVGLELDAAAILHARRVMFAAHEHVDLGVVLEVEPGREPGIELGVVPRAVGGEKAHEAGEGYIEGTARKNLGRPCRRDGSDKRQGCRRAEEQASPNTCHPTPSWTTASSSAGRVRDRPLASLGWVLTKHTVGYVARTGAHGRGAMNDAATDRWLRSPA